MENKNTTTILTNTVVWHLLMMNTLNVLLNKHLEGNKLILIPYIYNSNSIDIDSIINCKSNQLYLAYLAHFSWKKGSSDWNKIILNKISNLSEGSVDNVINKIVDQLYVDNDLKGIEKLNQNYVLKLIEEEKRNKNVCKSN